MSDDRWVLIYVGGSESQRYHVIGPFDTLDEAGDWVRERGLADDWKVTRILTPGRESS